MTSKRLAGKRALMTATKEPADLALYLVRDDKHLTQVRPHIINDGWPD